MSKRVGNNIFNFMLKIFVYLNLCLSMYQIINEKDQPRVDCETAIKYSALLFAIVGES